MGRKAPQLSSSWTLTVRTTLTNSLDLEFRDRASLVAQLALFKKAPLGDPYRLHEFRNERGVLIAFISKAYVSHCVEPPHADFQ